MTTYTDKTTARLTARLRARGITGEVIASNSDSAGKYLLNQGRLPLRGLGWNRREAEREIDQLTD